MVTKLCLPSGSGIRCCLLWPGTVLAAGHSVVWGARVLPLWAQVLSVIRLQGCQCCTGEEGGAGPGPYGEGSSETAVRAVWSSLQAEHGWTCAQTLLHQLLAAALPGRTVIPDLQMSRWDPRGEFTGPHGRAVVCWIPTLDPKLALFPCAAPSAQAPVWPETLVWEPVFSEDLPVYSWQIPESPP